MTRLLSSSIARLALVSLAALILGLFGSPGVMAQAPDAEVDFFLLPPAAEKPYTVGDHIVLRLEVTHPVNSRVGLPAVEEQWGDLEVIDQTGPEVVRNGDGTATTGKNIIVAVYEPGQYQTEPLVVTHQKADGSVEELGTPIIPFKVESVLVEGDTELRNLKPQAVLPLPPIWPWILAGFIASLLLAGVLAGAGLWLYHRWQKQQVVMPTPLTPVMDPRSPEVIAYAELDRIAALNLPAKEQFKEHYSLVTNCLRRYIEGRYQIPALERTTGELRLSFGLSLVPAEIVRNFMDLFMESDFVKFARFRPNSQDAYRLVDKARNLVEMTTPKPEPPGESTQTEIAAEVAA